MGKKWKPAQIARELKISTSALRHYESWGIVPPPERAANGYRLYTDEHYAYFACIRAMFPGFGMDTVRKVLLLIQQKRLDDAMWLINEQQSGLYQDKRLAERTIELLEADALEEVDRKARRAGLTIREISELTGVPSSAIRHWEKEGLLELPRNSDNGYRYMSSAHVRQISIIRTLRSANHPLDVIRQVMRELDHHHVENARRIARDAVDYLNHRIRHQIRGAHYFYKLCLATGLMQEP
ncbi:MerR family transcriptional regulator [Paenibacillus sp. LHD-117]|uniref:MerR family transcriptional regulator n=1 Tax=Paenibacillus sp. LHD-117 TaxID=3071412 RepID=UPI0027E11287|nr:MerR family transcriptional regulator [Paenibacillus sp. LHD-117]MDQ6420644.1 MerR family transcriptional regulator [Paenibacillus sp. LHD-117]